MNKKGFMFIETIVVLVVVALSLTTLLTSYSLIQRKAEARKHYDLPSDLYLVYSISRLGSTKSLNYQKTNSFITTRDTCASSYMGNLLSDCAQVFKDTDLIYYGVIKNVEAETTGEDPTRVFDNGTLEYLKTLKKCKTKKSCKDDNNDAINYVFGVFYRTGNYYYAATEI